MSNSKDVSHWIDQIKDGDSTAANRLWQHYFDRLVRSVRHRLYGQNRAVSAQAYQKLDEIESAQIR